MADSSAEEFRKKADECRRLALDAGSGSDKDAWLRLADNWGELAEAAETHRRI
jgi:hypothetical protein